MRCPVVELAKELIRRPSVSPIDAGCQVLLVDRLRALGFVVESFDLEDTKNFWAWRGKGTTLVFAGHTDVVPPGEQDAWSSPPFEPSVREDYLFGRGAADMKGSLAAMVVAAERFVAEYSDHRKRLAFLITSDEEGKGTNGTAEVVKKLMARNERLDYCLVGEPSSVVSIGDVIKNGRRGSLSGLLTVHGTQGHVAYPQLADNPIHRILPALHELITTQWDKGNAYFPATSMQLVQIEAGDGTSNVIPGKCHILFNFRFSPEITDVDIRRTVDTLLKRYQLHYTLEWTLSGQPFLTKEGNLLDSVKAAVLAHTGNRPVLDTGGGTSDGRFIALAGAEVVELGPVNVSIHKANECVSVPELQKLSLIYQHIMELLVL